MEAKIIKSEEEYFAALERVESLLHAAPDTPEADALELWSFLVDEYESREYGIDFPDPISAIKFRMEQQALHPRDLEPYLGSEAEVAAVLTGERELSLEMIRNLHRALDIPLEVLIQESSAAT